MGWKAREMQQNGEKLRAAHAETEKAVAPSSLRYQTAAPAWLELPMDCGNLHQWLNEATQDVATVQAGADSFDRARALLVEKPVARAVPGVKGGTMYFDPVAWAAFGARHLRYLAEKEGT